MAQIFLDICIFSFLDGHACDSFYANQMQGIPLEQFLSVHSLIDEQGTKNFLNLNYLKLGYNHRNKR